MAAKSILGNGYSYNDLFDTYDALQSGSLSQTQVGTTYYTSKQGFMGLDDVQKSRPIMANAGSIGSILKKTDELNAYKKRKQEQTNTAQQGAGRTQSILGGTVV